MSLADFYNEMVSVESQSNNLEDEITKLAMDEAVNELVAEAEATDSADVDEDIMKLAAEYDAAGRIMARAFFSEMMKAAQENEEGAEEKKEEKEEEKGKEKGKEKEEEKGKEKKKGFPPALAAAIQEKKAAIKRAMLENPEYAQQVLAHYQEND